MREEREELRKRLETFIWEDKEEDRRVVLEILNKFKGEERLPISTGIRYITNNSGDLWGEVFRAVNKDGFAIAFAYMEKKYKDLGIWLLVSIILDLELFDLAKRIKRGKGKE